MRRREFITLLGGAAGWPLAARAQQPERARRVGLLLALDESDPLSKADLSRFTMGLQELGWTDERNLRMDVRWGAGDVDRMRISAKELVSLQPDVIVTHATPGTTAVHRETRSVPIVFVAVSDPIGEGFVTSLPHPGGNLSGFIYTEPEMASKWLELLREIMQGLQKVAIMFGSDTAPGGGSYYVPVFEAAARSYMLASTTAPVRGNDEIETFITSLGRESGGGLLVMDDAFMAAHRLPIISLTAQHNVPAVYTNAVWVRDGGLLSYGTNVPDLFHRAASYVDRILRGEKPADLPVQVPTAFELVVNIKTAKALGLTVPPSLLLRADEVIE